MKSRVFSKDSLIALSFVVVSLVINYFATIYAVERASNSVTDIVLSNIPVLDVDGLFVYGPIIFFIFLAYVIFHRPETIPFTLKSIALFVLVRSLFITLTHIGPFPVRSDIESNFLSLFSSGGDLFFSGHTGLPFLMALLFWKDIRLRALFIASSIFFGAIVLLGHLHYSIDVAAAFFITYTIYHIAGFMFPRDKEMFAG